MEQSLTERLIEILERDRAGVPIAPAAPEAPDIGVDGVYPVGTIFHRNTPPENGNAAILVRTDAKHCMLICLPNGNRYSDLDTFAVRLDEDGVRKSEFHKAFRGEWEVSRRGKEALAEWARTEI